MNGNIRRESDNSTHMCNTRICTVFRTSCNLTTILAESRYFLVQAYFQTYEVYNNIC